MPESYVQLPADGAGKKLRTRQRTIGANVVEEQAVYRPGIDTFYAYADAVAFAANKHHIGIFNGALSGRVVQVRKLFAVNLQTGAVSGAVARFNIQRISAMTLGTAVVPQPADTANAALPATISVATGPTCTDAGVLFPWVTQTDEETAVPALSKALFQQSVNMLMEGESIQELTLRPGEGMSVKQITASTVGSFGWILVFTVETP